LVFVKRVSVILGCSKRLMKQIQYRINLLKTKRHSIVRQLREDVAQLIKAGYENIAFSRVSISDFFADIVTCHVNLESLLCFLLCPLSCCSLLFQVL
jgi:vacuolar protein sorting-associated protein IST1